MADAGERAGPDAGEWAMARARPARAWDAVAHGVLRWWGAARPGRAAGGPDTTPRG